jgi:hypothetical protein
MMANAIDWDDFGVAPWIAALRVPLDRFTEWMGFKPSVK